MSRVFVAVVVKASAASLRAVDDRLLEVNDCGPDAAAVRCPDTSADALAAKLSREFKSALVVRYDPQVGMRSARFYQAGKIAADLGECDETYLPLDDDGRPLADAPRVAFCRLDPLAEYAAAKNAIELGLELLGAGSWRELKRLAERGNVSRK